MSLSTEPEFYLNMQQFSHMKLGARNQSLDATKAVAQQFESLFVQQMLTSMRSASIVDEANHSTYTDFYQEMYDKQLAQTISKQGGLGIARMLMTQLPGGQDDPGNISGSDSGKTGKDLPSYRWQEVMHELPADKPAYIALNPAVKLSKLNGGDASAEPVAQPGAIDAGRWDKPADFVDAIWPHAQKAANLLGVSAQALIAQSALETGWGKYTMLSGDGKPAFNIFGIKAGQSWNGPTLARPTLEFRNGLMQTETAHFRAYDSISQALGDYVEFIQSSSRYEKALEHGGDDAVYLRGLQQAGYATDPEYADKIINIMQGQTFSESIAGLDDGQESVVSWENTHA